MGVVATDIDAPGLADALDRRGLALIPLADADWPGLSALLLEWRHDAGAIQPLVESIRARGWRGPLMLRVARGASLAVALAIDAGADDAVDARADPVEVAARLAALVRARRGRLLGIGDLLIDRIDRRVSRSGRPIDLLPREYALLLHLAERAGDYVSRRALLDSIWGLRIDPGTNVVAVHVSRLRAKIDRGFASPLIGSERGKGYRLAPG